MIIHMDEDKYNNKIHCSVWMFNNECPKYIKIVKQMIYQKNEI